MSRCHICGEKHPDDEMSGELSISRACIINDKLEFEC